MKLHWLFCLSLLSAAHLASAAKGTDFSGDSDIKRWAMGDIATLPAPAEDDFTLPELAQLKDWRMYPIDRAMGQTRVEIAADSLSVGKDDEIIRYAIAIIPPSGVRNLLFEGLDCNSSRYRTYAVGQTQPGWKKLDNIVWHVARLNVRNAWQGQLLKDFCGMTGPYKTDILVKAVRNNDAPPKPRD